LFYIALCPTCSVQEIAVALDLTERAVWGIIRLLRGTEMLRLNKDGRRHRYSVNLDAPLLHPTIQGLTLRPVLGEVVARGAEEPNDNCVRIA
jgi:DNA-binding transcriptional ArsR family regulator